MNEDLKGKVYLALGSSFIGGIISAVSLGAMMAKNKAILEGREEFVNRKYAHMRKKEDELKEHVKKSQLEEEEIQKRIKKFESLYNELKEKFEGDDKSIYTLLSLLMKSNEQFIEIMRYAEKNNTILEDLKVKMDNIDKKLDKIEKLIDTKGKTSIRIGL